MARVKKEDRLKVAIRLAQVYHAGQSDKVGQPYIGHPLRVMSYLLDPENAVNADDDTLITAVLHDTIEDTTLRLDRIRSLFGPSVSEAVDAISRREGEQYFDYIKRCADNDIAAIVKLADIADNEDPRRQWAGRASMVERYRKARAILMQEEVAV